MHLFWVAVYDKTEHMHRDPVANVVIYSALAFLGSVLGLVFGVPTYSMLADAGHVCARTTDHGVHDTLGMD